MEKMIEQMRFEKEQLVAENARLQAVNTQLQLENASLSDENCEYKQKLGLVPASLELPMSPTSLPPPSPSSSPLPLTISVSSDNVNQSSVVPPESAALTYDPQPQEQGTMRPWSPPSPGSTRLSSSPDLTPWVRTCVVTLSCVLVTLSMICRQSSPTPSPHPSTSQSNHNNNSSSAKLPLKKRNWDCWSKHPPPRL